MQENLENKGVGMERLKKGVKMGVAHKKTLTHILCLEIF